MSEPTPDKRKIKVTVKNREEKERFVRLSKGGDGGGQTQYFAVPADKREDWDRWPPGSSLTMVVSTKPNDDGEYIRGEIKLHGVDMTFILKGDSIEGDINIP